MKPYFQNESCTLYHGNALEIMVPDFVDVIDHVITDPPYSEEIYQKMANIDPSKTTHDLQGMAGGSIGAIGPLEIGIVMARIALIINRWSIIFSDHESSHLWRQAATFCGLRYVRTGAWVKPDAMPQMSGDRPAMGFEPATICHAKGAMRWNGGGALAVWTFNLVRAKDRFGHPCPKPIGLMRLLVDQFTDPGETILDPFCGSGTTLAAAREAGRKSIGIELNEAFCESAAKRLEEPLLDLFRTNGQTTMLFPNEA